MEEFVCPVSLILNSYTRASCGNLSTRFCFFLFILFLLLLLGNVFNLLWWNAVQMRNCMCCCLGCVCASFHVVCPARTEVGPVKRIMQRCRQSTAVAAASRDEATKWVFVLYIDGSLLQCYMLCIYSSFVLACPQMSCHVLPPPFIVYEKWVGGLFCCCRVHWM